MIINRGRSKFRIVIEPSKYYTCIGESIYSYEKQYMHLDEHSRVLFKTKDFDVGLISGSTIEDVSFEDLFLDMSSESEYSCEKIDVEGLLKRSPKPLMRSMKNFTAFIRIHQESENLLTLSTIPAKKTRGGAKKHQKT